MKHVAMNDLVEFGVCFFTKRGFSEVNGRYMAKVIVESEAFRQSTHGVVQFKILDKQIGKDIAADAEPKIISDKGASVLVDGDNCAGILTYRTGADLAVKKAKEYGIGFAAVQNTYWLGALGTYLIPIAEEGMLAQMWAQTNTCKDCAPYGGIDAKLSTNPVAMAFPTSDNPVIADFSTATMSMAAANGLARRNKRTATNRFIDKDGRPGNDAAVIKDGGSLMLTGGDLEGYKFYALSLFNEALTVMSGGSANNPDMPLHQSFALMVLDPAGFAGMDYYKKEMDRFLKHLLSSRNREGFELRLPGSRGFEYLKDCRATACPSTTKN